VSDGTTSALAEALHARAVRFSGQIGIVAKNLVSGVSIAIDGDTRFPSASLIKITVMLETYLQMDEGRLAAGTLVELTEAAKVSERVVLEHLRAGLRLSIADLLALMIIVSDNTATNLLLDLVGLTSVNHRLAAHGFTDTRILRRVCDDSRPELDPGAEREFGLGVTTPMEMALLLERIATRTIASVAACEQMLALLRAQRDRAMIPRLLPTGAIVANKTGLDLEKQPDDRGRRLAVRGDAAYVEAGSTRYVLAVLTRRGEDARESVDNEALATRAEIARLVHGYFAAQ
jgi:beta-lactamase class A